MRKGIIQRKDAKNIILCIFALNVFILAPGVFKAF